MGSSAPSYPTQTTQTQNINSVPDFLQPHVSTLLGAASNQMYTFDSSGGATGFQPYKPWSTNAQNYVAPLSPLQQQAISGAQNLQMPGQYNTGTNFMTSAGIQAVNAGAQGVNVGNQGMNIGAQGMNAGAQYAQQATDPNSIQAFMSPYMQDVVNQQIVQANRQYDITGTQEMGTATQMGAFGGSREAIMAAENERNRNQEIAQIQATGSQNAFQQAQQAQQFASQQGIAGLNAATAGLNVANQGYNTSLASSGALQNAATGLQGLGTAQLTAQQGIIGSQTQQGAIQQAQQQAIIDAATQQYQQAQQYPFMQMQALSGLIRGTPISTSGTTATINAAQPSYASQIIGGLGAAGNIYQATKKEGGIVGYSVGGSIESDLYDMTPQQLQDVIQNASSDIERSIAKKVLTEKSMAGGGIVAFADGKKVKDPYREAVTSEGPGIEDTELSGYPGAIADNLMKAPGRIADVAEQGANTIYHLPKNIHSYFQNVPEEASMRPPGEQRSLRKEPRLNMADKISSGIQDLSKWWHGDEAQAASAPAATQEPMPGIDTAQATPAPAVSTPGINTVQDASVPPPEDIPAGQFIALAHKNRTPEENVLFEAYKQNNPESAEALLQETAGNIPVKRVTNSGTPNQGQGGVYQAMRNDIPSGGVISSRDVISSEDESYNRLLQEINNQSEAGKGEAAKSIEQRYQEMRDVKQKLGLGEDEATQQYRKELMAERANSKDEAERQGHLRMAEFFAHWGSTPGPILAAGLKSLNETMPGFLQDKKDQKDLKHALDESIFKLNEADQKEKMGDFEGAVKTKEQLSDELRKTHGNRMIAAMMAKMEARNKLEVAQVYGQLNADKQAQQIAATQALTTQKAALEGGVSDSERLKSVDAEVLKLRESIAKHPYTSDPDEVARLNALVAQQNALRGTSSGAPPPSVSTGNKTASPIKFLGFE